MVIIAEDWLHCLLDLLKEVKGFQANVIQCGLDQLFSCVLLDQLLITDSETEIVNVAQE